MNNMIIQISTCVAEGSEDSIYGLDDKGKLYYWGTKTITQPFNPAYSKDDVVNRPKKIYGWIEMKDEINNS